MKTIPRSLLECTETDDVSSSLWRWKATLEKPVALTFLCLNIIAGFITGMIIADQNNDESYFLLALSAGVVGGIIAYYFFRAIALLIGALASNVENTRVSADVALYEAAKREKGTASGLAENAEIPAESIPAWAAQGGDFESELVFIDEAENAENPAESIPAWAAQGGDFEFEPAFIDEEEMLEAKLQKQGLIYVQYLKRSSCNICGNITEVEQYKSRIDGRIVNICENCLKRL